jgi:hypothetical protein
MSMKMLSLLLFIVGIVSVLGAPFTFGASAAGAVVAFFLSMIIEEAAA